MEFREMDPHDCTSDDDSRQEQFTDKPRVPDQKIDECAIDRWEDEGGAVLSEDEPA